MTDKLIELRLLEAQRCHQRLMAKRTQYHELAVWRAERIRSAHDAGASWGQIAKALGVTKSAVSRFAKEVTQ